jgi:hypothetical protein
MLDGIFFLSHQPNECPIDLCQNGLLSKKITGVISPRNSDFIEAVKGITKIASKSF